MKKISKITVRLESVTSFDRVNEHIPAKYGTIVEKFFAITMSDANGAIYVNYTRQDTAFAQYVAGPAVFTSIGSLMTVGFEIVEFRDDEYGPHYKVARVQVGGYADAIKRERAAKKRNARLAKLGIL